MATNATFPPYEYIGEGGQFVGIDVEIAQAIAEKLGMTLEIKDVDFGSILGGVESGKYDMGMAGLTVTPDRLKSVNFTTPYAKGVQVVIVKADSGITSIDDLAGKKIGVQQDTTGDIYASMSVEEGGFGEENVTRYKSGNDAVLALTSGKVQAVIIDKDPANSYVKANEGLTILESAYADEDYAIAIAKNNTELLQKVNKALEELIADGTVASIVNKYIPAEG
jgi:polar amino acid transport system substrate-binding protein